MVYEEFLSLLDRAKQLDSRETSVDSEAFPFYLAQIDSHLDAYFDSYINDRAYDILKSRSLGYTLEEIGNHYEITRERVRQIISNALTKLRDPKIVEGNVHLRSVFSLLCGIGEAEIIDFLYYLLPKKHILLLIISDDLYKESINFEKRLKELEFKERKKKERVAKRVKFSPDDEIKKALRLFLKHRSFTSMTEIADEFVEEYQNGNKYQLTGKVTWNKAIELLYEMQHDGEIGRKYGKITLLK